MDDGRTRPRIRLNLSELGRSMGVTDHTIRHYVDLLSATFMVRALQPWFENISKRQVKSPKLYGGLRPSMSALSDLELDRLTVVHARARDVVWTKRPLVRSMAAPRLADLKRLR